MQRMKLLPAPKKNPLFFQSINSWYDRCFVPLTFSGGVCWSFSHLCSVPTMFNAVEAFDIEDENEATPPYPNDAIPLKLVLALSGLEEASPL